MVLTGGGRYLHPAEPPPYRQRNYVAAGVGRVTITCVIEVPPVVRAGAMLLERLGPSLYDLGVPFDRRLEILTGLAQGVWRPCPAWTCRPPPGPHGGAG
jgi:hypothetical protein